MSGPRATLEELSDALTAAGVGVYLYDGAKQSARWITGGSRFASLSPDGDPPLTPLMQTLSTAEVGMTAAPVDHHLVRLDDGPEGSPRFFGVIRAADRGTETEDETLRRCLGSSDGRSGLQAHLTHLAETLDASAHVALCALGVDGMREFCRVYGYDTGEMLLRAVGRRLLEALPDHAVLARIGGAKYAAVLLGADADALRAQAEALAELVHGESFEVGMGPVSVTLSVGGTLAQPAALRTPELFDAALAALDEARGEGEGGLFIADSALDNPLSPAAMRAGAQAVMRALEDNRIAIAYQPVVTASDPGRVAFRECLARVRGDDGRWIAAGFFLPKIERLDLIRTLDRRVLRLALEALKAHPTERLSVNVSVRTMKDRAWLRELRHAAEAIPGAVERLIVELTESAAVVDAVATKAFLDEIRSLGVAIALDDFGAGYSSFRYVRDFRPDWVKIDGGFVKGVAHDPDNKLFVDTLVGIARNFDMATVAEFVETEEDAEALRVLGVDCLQGYHYGRPEIEPAWEPAIAQGAG
jgi:diguanylate cyclase (GGDEF)-like protein